MTAAEIAILLSAKNTAKGILEAAQGDLRGFERALDGAARTSRTATAQMEGDMRRVAAATKGLGAQGAVNDFEAYAGKAEGTAARVATSAEKMGGSVSLASGLAGAALLGAGAGAAVMAGQFVASSAQAATNWEAMTTRISHNAGLSIEDTDRMKKAILDLNLETGQPLDKLAAGYMHVVDVTHNAAAATDILTVADHAAVAAGGDVEHYANILALAMHEYGTDVSHAATEQQRQAEIQANASKTMNIFRQAAMDSNLTLEQFADHTARVIGLAARLGIPIEDVAAAYASLTKRGFDASQAQTQLVGAMTHMINPSKAAQTEIAALSKKTGIDLVHDFSAAGLSEQGLEKAMDDLNLAFMQTGMTQAEATQESMKLVNAQRGGLGVAALATNAQQDYNDELNKLRDTAGLATTMNNQYNESLDLTQTKADRTAAKFELLKRNIGEQLLPEENRLLDIMLDPQGAWDHAGEEVEHYTGLLEHIPGPIGAAATAWDGWTRAVEAEAPNIGVAFDNIGIAIGSLGPIVNNIIGKLGNLKTALWNDINAELQLSADMPGYAMGTDYAPGGLALVGEQGPEIVRLPRGSQVIPNHRLNGEMGGRMAIDYDRLAKAIARALPQPSLRGEAIARAEQRRMGQTLAVLQGTVDGLQRAIDSLEKRTLAAAA